MPEIDRSAKDERQSYFGAIARAEHAIAPNAKGPRMRKVAKDPFAKGPRMRKLPKAKDPRMRKVAKAPFAKDLAFVGESLRAKDPIAPKANASEC